MSTVLFLKQLDSMSAEYCLLFYGLTFLLFYDLISLSLEFSLISLHNRSKNNEHGCSVNFEFSIWQQKCAVDNQQKLTFF